MLLIIKFFRGLLQRIEYAYLRNMREVRLSYVQGDETTALLAVRKMFKYSKITYVADELEPSLVSLLQNFSSQDLPAIVNDETIISDEICMLEYASKLACPIPCNCQEEININLWTRKAYQFQKSRIDQPILNKIEKQLALTGWIAQTAYASCADFIWNEILIELPNDVILGTNTKNWLLRLADAIGSN